MCIFFMQAHPASLVNIWAVYKQCQLSRRQLYNVTYNLETYMNPVLAGQVLSQYEHKYL